MRYARPETGKSVVLGNDVTGEMLHVGGEGFNTLGLITNMSLETGEKSVYAYDGLNRLTNALLYNTGGVLTNTMKWTYDLAGNRLSKTESAVTTYYTYSNGVNRLTTWGANTTNLFDSSGNITNIKYGATTNIGLKYDVQNQVTETRTNGVLCETFTFDALGRRVSIISGTDTNYLVYDGANVIADLNQTGGVKRTYTWAGIDNMLCMTVYTGATAKVYYPLKDCLGSIVAMVDGSTGNIAEQYRYDAWGRTTVMNAGGAVLAQSAIGNRYCWTGREYSYKTGLYFHRTRLYEPLSGRWLSPDKFGISGGNNLYAYCGNQPVSSLDEFGLCSDTVKEGFFKGLPKITWDNWNTIRPENDYVYILGPNGYELDPRGAQSPSDVRSILGEYIDRLLNGNPPPDFKVGVLPFPSGGRFQLFKKFKSQKQAEQAIQQAGGPFQKKVGGKTRTAPPERHEKGSKHLHDKNHNDPTKPNVHYGFPD